MKKANTLMFTLVLSFISLTLYAQDTPEQEILQDLNKKSATSTKAPSATNTWTGAANNYWGNYGNWSLGHAPTATEDVVIPNVNMPCIVDYSDKTCLNLTINSGAAVTINDQALDVMGSVTVYGSIEMTNTLSELNITDDIWWESGSTATMTASATININGYWIFQSGANVQLSSGYVDFEGSTTSYIRSYESNCHFNHIRNHKTSSTVAVSSMSTEDLHVAGNIYNYSNCTFGMFSNHSVILDGFFNNMGGHIHCIGTFVFNGNPSAVPLKPNTGDYFNNLTLNMTSGTLELDNTYNNELHINGDLTINSGVLKANSFDIYLKGDWTNNVGTGGLFPGNETVIFTANTKHQDVNGATVFNDVVQNDHLYYLHFNDNVTIGNLTLKGQCWAYEDMNISGVLDLSLDISKFSCGFGSNPTVDVGLLKQGGYIVVSDAVLNINNLYEDAILGSYELTSSGGEINIDNSGDFVDLKGEIHIADGTMTVIGTVSWWPYQHDAVLDMSGGVLDFPACGIRISDSSYSFTTNITGGVIRTAYDFWGERADFTPAGGAVELYGTSDASLVLLNGCTLNDIIINKSSKSSGAIPPPGAVYDLETRKLTNNKGKSNTVSLLSDISIKNDLQITAGTLNINGKQLLVPWEIHIFGNLSMTLSTDIVTCYRIYWESGSTDNITNGEIHCHYWTFNEGTNAQLGTGNIAYISSSISPCDPNASFGNLTILPSVKMNLKGKDYYPVRVSGDCLFQSGSTWFFAQLYVDGTWEIESGAVVFIWPNVGVLYCNDLILNGTLSVNDSSTVEVHNNFDFGTSGELNIDEGSFIIDAPASKAIYSLNGTLNLIDGVLECTNNSISLSNTSNNIEGGTIRCGGSLISLASGAFQATGGTVEFFGSQTGNYIYMDGSNYFNDIVFNKSTTILIYPAGTAFPLIVKGDLSINSGGFSANGNDIYIEGNWADAAGGFNPTTGMVTFNGANAADITTDETFYNLELDKTYGSFNGLELSGGITVTVTNNLNITDGTMEMNSNSTLDVQGDINITNGGGLNAYSDSGLQLFLGGNLTDNNSSPSSLHGYFPGNEVFTFNGTGNQYVTTTAPEEMFGNLVIDKPSGKFKPNNNIYVVHDFDLQDGEWIDNVNGLSHSFEEDFVVHAGGYFSNATNKNTVNFISDKNATVSFSTSGASNGIFNAVVIDKSAVKSFVPQGYGEETAPTEPVEGSSSKSQTLSLGSNVFCGYDAGVTVQNATLDLNGHTFTSTGDLDINTYGNVLVGEGATLKIDQDNHLNIHNGGTLTTSGTSSNPATITHYNPGYYYFNVNSGGTLSAEHTIFEYMTNYGIYFISGSTLNPSHALDYCTLQNTNSGPYSSSITFDNDQTVTCTNVTFVDNPGYNVWKSNNSGNVTFSGATGDYAGPEYEYDPYDRIDWEDIDIELSLTAMLEGPYNGTDMNTTLNTLGLIPLNQPFDSNTNADWYYTGTESVGSIPAGVVDWVLVQLRDADDVANADESTIVAQQAAFILSDGSIVDLDGTSNILFDNVDYTSKLYTVVYHRNHLGVIADDRIVKSGGICSYDFTSSGAAYSNTNTGEKNIGGAVWGMFSGDASGGGIINNYDHFLWGNYAGQQGYQACDFDLDGQIDNVDKNEFYIDNLENESQIPESKSNNDN